jgi:Na+/H+-translocating membrane pyrophosphatase
MYGGVVSALGMLSTITICLTINAYGPINDNTGGIAEMARMSHRICERTDALDVARNTIAAFGKVDYMLVLSDIHVVAQRTHRRKISLFMHYTETFYASLDRMYDPALHDLA